MHVSSTLAVRPLLKWAGGKRQLLPALANHYPQAFTRYVEPFAGSAAVFFDLLASGRLANRRVLLADVNADLIACYRAVRDRVDDVIRELAALEREHRCYGDACYYDVRDRRFNPARAALSAEARAASSSPALAAMLIFLNRTGFNGLFRLNRTGGFNVPAGRYANPRICDPDHLRSVSAALNAAGVQIELQPFDATLSRTGAGDFLYCDPPYAPLSPTASFASYTADGFSAFDQKRLQQAVVSAVRRGAQVVLSNSSAPAVLALYGAPEAIGAGLDIHRVPARRAINARAASRGPVDEVIVTNIRLNLARPKARMARIRPRVTRRTA